MKYFDPKTWCFRVMMTPNQQVYYPLLTFRGQLRWSKNVVPQKLSSNIPWWLWCYARFVIYTRVQKFWHSSDSDFNTIGVLYFCTLVYERFGSLNLKYRNENQSFGKCRTHKIVKLLWLFWKDKFQFWMIVGEAKFSCLVRIRTSNM